MIIEQRIRKDWRVRIGLAFIVANIVHGERVYADTYVKRVALNWIMQQADRDALISAGVDINTMKSIDV